MTEYTGEIVAYLPTSSVTAEWAGGPIVNIRAGWFIREDGSVTLLSVTIRRPQGICFHRQEGLEALRTFEDLPTDWPEALRQAIMAVWPTVTFGSVDH